MRRTCDDDWDAPNDVLFAPGAAARYLRGVIRDVHQGPGYILQKETYRTVGNVTGVLLSMQRDTCYGKGCASPCAVCLFPKLSPSNQPV